MKIAYIYTALTTVGGADRVVTEKANYFAEKYGFDISVITDSQKDRPPVFPLSNKVKLIDLGIDFGQQYKYRFIRRGLCYFKLMTLYKCKLKELLCKSKFDIVISTCGRDLDFLCDIKDGSLKVGESHIAKKFCRNFHLMEARGFPYKQVAKYWRCKQEQAVKRLDAFVVLTQQDADSWKEVRNACVIPNSLPFYPSGHSTCENKKIITVGRLNEQKGYDLLIPAWDIVQKHVAGWTLNIFGDGELYPSFISEIKKRKLSDSLHIYPSCKDIETKYLDSSIYVMSSRFEGFGMVLLEAMSCGVPCISFDCPYGPSTIIHEKENGLLVENGNIEALAHAIIWMIEHENERKQMGLNAKKSVQKFSPDNIMRLWLDLFHALKRK